MVKLPEWLRPHRVKSPIKPIALPVERIDIQSGIRKLNIPDPSNDDFQQYRKMARETYAEVRAEAKSLSDRELLERIFISLNTMNL